jgi:hypothetical protein
MAINNRLFNFKNDSNNLPFIYTVWGYGIFAIPAVKFTIEETMFHQTALILRAIISDIMVLGGFSIMSGVYGYFGYSHDFFLCSEYAFRFTLKYLCVVEPARMLWKLIRPYYFK